MLNNTMAESKGVYSTYAKAYAAGVALGNTTWKLIPVANWHMAHGERHMPTNAVTHRF